MQILFVILIVLASGILGLIVLVQNPKGGGLTGNIAGFSTQFMGVKQTTDVLEKGTWIFGAVIAALCLASSFFISSSGTTVTGPDRSKDATGASIPANNQQQQPGTTVFPVNPVKPPDSTK
jgi:preprotein translocase subunit SecG